MRIFMRLAVASSAMLISASAMAADQVKLTVHHFLNQMAPAQTRLIEPWAKRVEEDSGGRISVEIYPSMSLGGKPNQLFQQAEDGIADIVWTVAGYTPGRFPKLEVFELPFVHLNDPVATNLAIRDMLATDFADEFKTVKPLLVHVHAGQTLNMVDAPVRSPADVQGKKIRIPGRVGGWVVEALGGSPIGMPVPDVPAAISKRVIDGVMVPFEVVPSLKLDQLTRGPGEGANGERFGTAVFIFAMNKAKYDGLPEDLKAVIDRNSGADFAREIGKAWLAAEDVGRKAYTDRGTTIAKLTPDELAAFRTALAPVEARWIEDAASKGIDAAALVARARERVAAHGE
ncbi:TRAP transporter substrate-binding protein [Tistrella mobilis]|uniref:TRAP transporter substrate-binding protein n=1 Tax=Tistrella mobilis TaxID=171437 RepID=UPI0035573324